METRVIKAASGQNYSDILPEVRSKLNAGALVIFPTETVYGIAANAANPDAVARLRAAGVGTASPAYTVHLARKSDAARFMPESSPVMRRLARKVWPGPLTLLGHVSEPAKSPISQQHPRSLDAIFDKDSVSLRCPNHPVFQALIAGMDAPIIASGAGKPGAPPAFDANTALGNLPGVAEFALDAGPTALRQVSTVVELRGHAWAICRLGAIDERTVTRLARSEILFVCTGNSCRSPMAEYLFRRMLSERLGFAIGALAEAGYFVRSAGTAASQEMPASRGTLDELTRRGVDARRHRSQHLTVELVQRAERIYVMTSDHLADVLDLAPEAAGRVSLLDADGPINDPIGGGPEQYALAAEQIEQACRLRLEEFVREDLNW